MNILALNAGSSSLKYRLFRMDGDAEEVIADGLAERVDGNATQAAAQKAIAECKPHGIDAVGHRVVHGGSHFSQPTIVTPEMLTNLRGLVELDPLHNPVEVELIQEAQRLLPGIPAVAVFDTAFHQTMPPVAYHYALPQELAARLNLRRYGFHGISHQYVSEMLLQCENLSAAGTRLITCHLGSGASVCAIRDGKSIDTSMGMTPLEGLVMGTRSGDVDPGLLLYLLRSERMTPTELDDLLNHGSGLLGLSGLSGDVRQIEQAACRGDANAELALDVFAYRVRKYIGSYAAILGGLDALAFTGGIGEHSDGVRARICGDLGFLGLHLDPALNEQIADRPIRISSPQSRVHTWVIPTDEERQIARETRKTLSV